MVIFGADAADPKLLPLVHLAVLVQKRAASVTLEPFLHDEGVGLGLVGQWSVMECKRDDSIVGGFFGGGSDIVDKPNVGFIIVDQFNILLLLLLLLHHVESI